MYRTWDVFMCRHAGCGDTLENGGVGQYVGYGVCVDTPTCRHSIQGVPAAPKCLWAHGGGVVSWN